MIDQFGGPSKIFAAVSDSYDLWNAVSKIWGEQLKERVENNGGRLVVRPDSGDPLTIPLKTVIKLGEKFGYTVNSKGFKVLPNCIRVIQGDGITIDSIPIIIKNVLDAGWSIENLAFGMGGGLLQQVNRDTQRFAMKVSAAKIDGKWIDVFKNPKTDPSKASKKGRFVVYKEDGKFKTDHINNAHDWEDLLRTVYLDGNPLINCTFDEVRKTSNMFS
jgi:nicotinamide phosphoribosyltransferase